MSNKAELEDFIKKSKEYNLIPVFREIRADLDTPLSIYLKLSKNNYSFLLESITGGENLARYSIIGTNPKKVIKTGKNEEFGEVDPLEIIKNEINSYKVPEIKELPVFTGGAVGYLSYETISYFEKKVPKNKESTLNVPESIFMITDSIVVFDHVKQTIFIVNYAKIDDSKDINDVYTKSLEKIDEIYCLIKKPIPEEHNNISSISNNEEKTKEQLIEQYTKNMSKEDYKIAIEKCIDNIYSGEIIQIVFSQRLTKKTKASALDIYRCLRTINPSPYMFMLNFKDFEIIGASPELLVKSNDKEIEVHPIAGTRPRGINSEEDDLIANELISDEKELAEHLMLLDLGRNDVGRVSTPGTVNVNQKMEIEKYSHIMHIVSNVTGKLDSKYDEFDALRAAFPAGTVSGAPKVRAMQLISELEPEQRGPYSGGVGYFSYNGNMDTCIAIRTLMLKDETVYLQAGGGIVADSKVDYEYEETINKMMALIKSVEDAERNL
ncbi:MAG: anthranilate synthase component I [Dehalococcoidia bacterium]|nr:MAG: anthranilate synthase component I [Chloroflexi bacterium TMED230]RZP13358.1 MAG: anthranilate synthase component I [Chloroflexota bacterium]|tara:strand:- start:2417 stop:3898 length:1482 start_codon:yes stop_codon:yes gene_type:complete